MEFFRTWNFVYKYEFLPNEFFIKHPFEMNFYQRSKEYVSPKIFLRYKYPTRLVNQYYKDLQTNVSQRIELVIHKNKHFSVGGTDKFVRQNY